MGVAVHLVGALDFKSSDGLTRSMVGSIPIYSRQVKNRACLEFHDTLYFLYNNKHLY